MGCGGRTFSRAGAVDLWSLRGYVAHCPGSETPAVANVASTKNLTGPVQRQRSRLFVAGAVAYVGGMKLIKDRPATVAEYIAAAEPECRKKLREMRACVRGAIPRAIEELKWGMPAYSYRRILVIFGGFKKHIGFYPTTSAMRAFTKELAKFKTARGSIQFPLDKPLPRLLIRRITAYRALESVKKDGKWKS